MRLLPWQNLPLDFIPASMSASQTKETLNSGDNTAHVVALTPTLQTSQDTPNTSDTPKIPPTIPQNPQKWSPNDVKAYLKHNQQKFFLKDRAIDTILGEDITGDTFLTLTNKVLREVPFSLSYGAASIIVELINVLKTPKVSEEKKQFSSYKNMKDIVEILSKRTQGDVDSIKNITQFRPTPCKIADNNEELLHCLKEIHHRLYNMGSVVDDNEAVRCEFISSILHACLRIARRITNKEIILYPQLTIAGGESTGRVDYAIKAFEDLICITEGKHSDITAGFVQNIVQCDSAIQENARKRKLQDDNNYVYGIITTATEWFFTVITPTDIFCTSQKPLSIRLNTDCLTPDSQDHKMLHQEVKAVMEIIVALLKERAAIVQEPEKKRWRGENST